VACRGCVAGGAIGELGVVNGDLGPALGGVAACARGKIVVCG